MKRKTICAPALVLGLWLLGQSNQALAAPRQPVSRAGHKTPSAHLDTTAKAVHGRRASDKATKPAPRAESVGFPNEGRLENGVRLDTKLPYVRVVPKYLSGDVRWGLPELVNMLERAARAVAKQYPGSALEVGDLSGKNGGELQRHHSHESGRDADIGFYAVNAKGKQVRLDSFVRFDTNLRALNAGKVGGAQFDLARNWLFIDKILTDPHAHVSHIFIVSHLREQLLAYAKPRVSSELYTRAAFAMLQPSESLVHDDHFHIRISCPPSTSNRCIEIAKDAPLGQAMHTKRVPARAERSSPKSTRRNGARPTTRVPNKAHSATSPAASGRAPSVVTTLSQWVRSPALSLSNNSEAEGDAEVKATLDENGDAKITE